MFKKVIRFNDEVERSTVGFAIDSENNCVEITWIKGHAPYFHDVITFLLTKTPFLKAVNQLSKIKGTHYRKYPIKIEERVGMSGARDIKLFIKEPIGVNFAKTYCACSIHISMWGKLNERLTPMYLLDLADILVERGILRREIQNDGENYYHFELKKNMEISEDVRVEYLNKRYYLNEENDGYTLLKP